MLQYYGNIYSDTKEKLEELLEPLKAAGFDIAYQGTFGGTLIKEVEDEQETSEP